jgi:hypothetical protein
LLTALCKMKLQVFGGREGMAGYSEMTASSLLS